MGKGRHDVARAREGERGRSHSSVGTSETLGDLIPLLPSRVESSRQTSKENGYREVSEPSWRRGRTRRRREGKGRSASSSSEFGKEGQS